MRTRLSRIEEASGVAPWGGRGRGGGGGGGGGGQRGSGEGRQKGGATGRNGACLLKQQAREKPLAHCASPLYLQGGKTGLLCKNGFLKQQAREKPLAHCASPLKRHRGAALGGRPGRPGPGAEGRERILRCDART
ncbi:unnamed protein product [Prorocentrum cordatum]|uniref:Uncharacterized protein n=1 Tax=Prorocentrum cordatum TaxID=2364126 RepID=A0ABN9UFW2_9DINO|nr:unnamed protein product [Polarella glacialis]